MEQARHWLHQRGREELMIHLILGVITAVMAVCVVGITGFCIWRASQYFLRVAGTAWLSVTGLRLPDFVVEAAALTSTGCLLAALFAGHATAERSRNSRWWVVEARVLQEFVYAGPQLTRTAMSFFRTALVWAAMDEVVCARVLVFLLARSRRVSILELASQIEGFRPVHILPQLQRIAGVVHLPSPPPGLSLTGELRAELNRRLGRPTGQNKVNADRRVVFACPTCGQRLRLRHFLVGVIFRCPKCESRYESFMDEAGRIRLRRAPSPPPVFLEPGVRPPHEVLGVPEKAPQDMIKRAYRKLMKQHHPDLAGAGDSEAQARAEDICKEINQAYSTLMEKRPHM